MITQDHSVPFNNLDANLKLVASCCSYRLCGRHCHSTPEFDNHSPAPDSIYRRYAHGDDVDKSHNSIGYWAVVPHLMGVAW